MRASVGEPGTGGSVEKVCRSHTLDTPTATVRQTVPAAQSASCMQ